MEWKMNDPNTPGEWQEAVNSAYVMRAIADAVMYGLVNTNMEIDLARCDYLLTEGELKGFTPEPGIIDKAFKRDGIQI
jgi:hypothetical protein